MELTKLTAGDPNRLQLLSRGDEPVPLWATRTARGGVSGCAVWHDHRSTRSTSPNAVVELAKEMLAEEQVGKQGATSTKTDARDLAP